MSSCTCSTGFLSNEKCEPCAEGCSECTSATTCTACKKGIKLTGSKCEECDDDYHYNEDKKTCEEVLDSWNCKTSEYHAVDKKIGCGSCETETFIMETKYCKHCEGCL